MSTPGEVFDSNHDYVWAQNERANPKPALAAVLGRAAIALLRRVGRQAGSRVKRTLKTGFDADDPGRGSLTSIGFGRGESEQPPMPDDATVTADEAGAQIISNEDLIATAADRARAQLGGVATVAGPDASVGIHPAQERTGGRHSATAQHRQPLSPAQEAGAQIVENLEKNYGQTYPEIPRQAGDYRARHSKEDLTADDSTGEYPRVGVSR